MSDMNDGQYLGETLCGLVAGQTVFGRFRLGRMLGRGGMGVVWLARDEKLEEDIALKFLPESVHADSTSVDELKRETRKSRQLTHPSIVRIHDFVEDATGAAIAMEFIGGQTLAEKRLEKPARAFEPEEIRDWVVQICGALDYAHREAKIVHRDMKPANIMLSANQRIKITDFGIARSISDSVTRLSAHQPRSGSGSPPFMSPQQARGEPSTPLDDIYGLGATIYDLLTGKPPFFSGDIFGQIETRKAPSMSDRRREFQLEMNSVPAEWESLVADCLAKEMDRRPQSAGEVIDRLSACTAGPATEVKTLKKTPGLVVPKHVLWIGTGAIAMAAVLALALLTSVLYVLYVRTVPPSPTRLAESVPAPKADFSIPAPATALTPAILAGDPKEAALVRKSTGDFGAQMIKLGKMYAEGDGVAKNEAEAAKWFRQAGDQGNAEAQAWLGESYAKGRGVDKNEEEAAKWFALAAGQGNAYAQARLGELYAEGRGVNKNEAEAAKWFRLSADQEDALGQSNLGAVYANGQGVPKNDVEAVRLLRLAADQGNAEALTNLGVLSFSGRGGTEADALNLYRQAADLGNARAQFKIGKMYAEGLGVEQSYADAIKFLRLSADQGNADAQSHLGAMYLAGLGVSPSDAEAMRLFRLAADQGNADAQFFLGVMYGKGRGTPKNLAESIKWYRLAAAQGSVKAQNNLKNLGVKNEPDQAR